MNIIENILQILVDNQNFIIALIVAISFSLFSTFRKDVIKVLQLFLYRQVNNETDLTSVEELKKELEKLKQELTKDVIKDNDKIIDETIKNYIEVNLKIILEEKINDISLIKDSILHTLKNEVTSETTKFLSTKNNTDLINMIKENYEIQKKIENHNSMVRTLEKEALNASMLKMVMINLFVFATIGFLYFYITRTSVLPTETYISIYALYFSLGAFMLYIIRSSHFRTSVLLAIKEQTINYNNALEYLEKVKGSSILTEHDVEIVRMLLINRSEREQKADHPYEVILKGISGSNIQFKGGKMELGKNNSKIP